jgi:hypothetical protein
MLMAGLFLPFHCLQQMPTDWLFQTIWHLERDKQLGFVQTRWAFTNGYDNLLCW